MHPHAGRIFFYETEIDPLESRDFSARKGLFYFIPEETTQHCRDSADG